MVLTLVNSLDYHARSGDVQLFRAANLIRSLISEMPPVLHHFLADQFTAPAAWFEARLAFTRSCAVMSMIGFAVGLGDRHLENILIDSTCGSLMHVDFACLFDHGLNLLTPEKARHEC